MHTLCIVKAMMHQTTILGGEADLRNFYHSVFALEHDSLWCVHCKSFYFSSSGRLADLQIKHFVDTQNKGQCQV